MDKLSLQLDNGKYVRVAKGELLAFLGDDAMWYEVHIADNSDTVTNKTQFYLKYAFTNQYLGVQDGEMVLGVQTPWRAN